MKLHVLSPLWHSGHSQSSTDCHQQRDVFELETDGAARHKYLHLGLEKQKKVGAHLCYLSHNCHQDQCLQESAKYSQQHLLRIVVYTADY